jgi:hypothetical protein
MPLIKLAHAIDDLVVTITPSFEKFNQLFIVLDGVFISAITVFLFICIISTIINVFQELNRKFSIFSFLEKMFTVVENEFSAPRTFMIILILLITCLSLSSIAPVLSFKTPLALYMFITAIITLLGVILL